ncbi:MAG: DEAD/DEAH box helicase family protein [Lysobacter sp.]|nr:DEAD/DEAH box helicase family protein [Lysobacter sp.]
MDLANLELATEYRTGSGGASDPIAGFYLPCLSRSVCYLRAAGFFRSSILSLVGSAYIDFARRGGRAIVICSPKLEPGDVEAIFAGVRSYGDLVERRVLAEVEDLLRSSDLVRPVSALATLVALGTLKIFIAYRPNADGMYHEKIGCFQDENGNAVTFIGSANETYSAWAEQGNFESVEVFCSWHSARDLARTEKHEQYLKRLIENQVQGVTVVPFPEAAKRRLFERAKTSFDDFTDESKLPVTRSGKQPLKHQLDSLVSWANAGYRGVLQHATGSGKTFTAILAIADHIISGSPALVLVPSQLLQTQWRREIQENLPNAVLLLAGGGNQRWKDPYILAAHTSNVASPHPRVTIAVMATAGSKEFRSKIASGDHLLVVADEVHQIGSHEYSQFLETGAGKRLGLSATPQRHGDLEGTERIFRYFGNIIDPVVTLRDAIVAKRLVPYEYHSYGIRLSREEADEWRSLSKRIGFLLGSNNSQDRVGGAISPEAQLLLIRRARIAKKAERKIPEAVRILLESYQSGQRWLVYCEDVAHMEDLFAALKLRGITSTLYHSGMDADRNETLAWFDKHGGVMLAVRCLDEGIDIPSVTHALILASSQNPRQFVQRRGRILRKHPGKDHAVLHDLLVLPVDGDNDPLGSLESEFVRAVGFANDAMNVGSHAKLIEMALQTGIDLQKHYVDIEDEGNE